MQGDRKPLSLVASPFYKRNAQFSPDSKWVAYHSNESGRFEIYVVPFPPGGGKWQISTSGGISPRWSNDGKELFYIGPDGQLMAATIAVSAGSLDAASPVALFQTRIIEGGSNSTAKHEYDVSADGRFLINVVPDEAAGAPLTLLQNWKRGR
jgi:Tol biopolymer transport system component